MRPATNHLVRMLVADLSNEIRGSAGEYASDCRRKVAAIYRARHSVRLDEYGWPLLPEFTITGHSQIKENR